MFLKINDPKINIKEERLLSLISDRFGKNVCKTALAKSKIS
jgi:hypothetical protein